MITINAGFFFTIAVIALLILVSIQFTLNLILKELRALRAHFSRETEWQSEKREK